MRFYNDDEELTPMKLLIRSMPGIKFGGILNLMSSVDIDNIS